MSGSQNYRIITNHEFLLFWGLKTDFYKNFGFILCIMDQKDKEKIERIISDRKEAHEILLKKKSKVYNSFLELEKNTFKDSNLSKMYKELIALGISVIINCESCMEWHVKEALNSGASEDQIIETLEVAIEMGGGPATVSTRFAIKVLDFYRSKTS